MKFPTVKIEKDVRKGAIIVCCFFLLVTVPILISSYNNRDADLKMYDYFTCQGRTVTQILDPPTTTSNLTYVTSCARLKIDPKIVTFGEARGVLVGLYPFIIIAGGVLLVFMYQAAMEGF